jgi:glycosyltransferase involved in cell wall biosynthesis
VRALVGLPHHHLALVGALAAPARAELVHLADTLGVRDRVHLVGPARRPAYLASADFAVLGFVRPAGGPDPLPAGLSACARSGLTVIAADGRAARDFIADRGAGERYAPGDPASLAAAVRRARQRPKPGVERAERARTAPTPWRPLGSAPIRLGLGTANFAGQLSAFAAAICRERADVSAELVMAKPASTYRYPADVYIDFPREHRLDVQLEQARRVLGGYTHLIVDAFRPVLGRLNGDHIGADLPALARAGVKVALLAHGSEIRHPAHHLARHGCSAFRDAPEDLLPRLTAAVEQNLRTAQSAGLPLFVTTLDLLDDLPTATWAPQVIDVDAWACDRPPMQRPRPLVLHAPSARWTKGTDRILPVLQELDDRKVIEFRLVEGLPWDHMRDLVRAADVIVDQLVMGSYCTFACEGMAAGKPVVSYLGPGVEDRIGTPPPIISATPETVATALEALLDDRNAAVELGRRAVAYARQFHDGRRTAHAFEEFLR